MSYTKLNFSRMTMSDFLEIKPILFDDYDDFWNESTFEDELSSLNSYYIVAKQGDEIVGFTGMKIVLDEADIMNIVTKKDKRNLGIGTALLQELISVAKSHSIHKLTLEVSEINKPAIHLYEKLGFKKIANREKYYKNSYDAYIMQMIINN